MSVPSLLDAHKLPMRHDCRLQLGCHTERKQEGKEHAVTAGCTQASSEARLQAPVRCHKPTRPTSASFLPFGGDSRLLEQRISFIY
eukprot:1157891-Pelagomonas_calceolata.AAC.11